jgi:hypothetical protein
MSLKVKLGKEAEVKVEKILAFHGYSSAEEMIENLIDKEFEKIKSGGNKEEQAEALSGLGYIS